MEEEKINQLFRDPTQIVFGRQIELTEQLKFQETGLTEFLTSKNIQLFISREYEHQLLQISIENGVLVQRNITIPHPCGLAIDEHKNLWVASTRNPNQIVKLKSKNGVLLPIKKVSISGDHYLHDLVFHKKNIWATVTGKDAIGKWDNDADEFEISNLYAQAENHHQLNAIAFSDDGTQHFTVSTLEKQSYPPGHQNFIVDKKGGVIDQNGQTICTNLTRPHSLRFHKGKAWLCNSGEGEFGHIENGKFKALFKTNAWTRGLAFTGDYAIIGLSKILPRFSHYAPGVQGEGKCGIVIFNIFTKTIVAEIDWPNGNQHFGIEICGTNDTGKIPSKIELKEMKLEPFYSLI